jgi:tetratricopeptide (TPR) repeat protein
MSVRLPIACLVLAALSGAAWCLSAAAKPPDLPVKEQIVCEPTTSTAAQATPAEDDLHARAQQDTAQRTLCRCLLFAAHPLLGLLPVDEWLDGDEDTSPDTLPPGFAVYPDGSRVRVQFDDGFRVGVDFTAAEKARDKSGPTRPAAEEQEPRPEEPFTCPFLREKAARDQASRCAPQEPGSVLENLKKLEHAAQVYRRAESYRRRGRLAEARSCYESIRDLCPGSRFAQLAGERLEQMHVGEPKHADEATGEEEDASPPPAKAEPGKTHSSLLQRESRAATLLEHCRRAFQAGHYDQAARLASQAAALDPPSVAANPLVYKLGLLTQLRAKIEQLPRHPAYLTCDQSGGPGPGGLEQVIELMYRYCEFFKKDMLAEAELCALQALALDPNNPTVLAAARLVAIQRLTHPPVSEPAVCPWAGEPHTTMRQPDLPPVDPRVVGAMERILTEVGEPGPGKLTVTVEEQGAAEEQEEPAGSAEEVPTLLLDPPGDDPADHAAGNLSLQDLLDALRSGACVEVDGPPLCRRGQC